MWGDRDHGLLAWPVDEWGPGGWEPAISIPWGTPGIVVESYVDPGAMLPTAHVIFPQGFVKCPVELVRLCKSSRT